MMEEETAEYEKLLNTWDIIFKKTQEDGCEFLVLPILNWGKLWLI